MCLLKMLVCYVNSHIRLTSYQRVCLVYIAQMFLRLLDVYKCYSSQFKTTIN